MRTRRWMIAAAMVAAVGALASGAALAGKKPSGGSGTGGGTIYFHPVGEALLWTMAADGTGKAALPAGVDGEPGYLQHSGHRWFLRLEMVAGTYPDGWERREVFAVRDDGLVEVQLTDDAMVKPSSGRALTHFASIGSSRFSARWAKDDSFFSYSGADWSDGTPVSRLFKVALAFDGAGTPAASGSPVPVASLDYVNGTGSNVASSAFSAHDWSPDGSQVAWTESDYDAGTEAAWVTTLSGGTPVMVGDDRLVTSWSSAGRLLLADGGFSYGSYATFLETRAADGTAPLVVLLLERRHETSGLPDRLFPGAWSPSGTHIVYEGQDDTYIVTGRTDIYRITAAGGEKTCLTADMPGNFRSYGVTWR